ncbi:type II toxin-antitoxin system death-on-curing family toxin [Acidicapsa acidisoli]|uniref:type II toxin-antitoxin system death-on-curing family toxin n=1 Tax=Acidicapsa acidisoli TaxID=1615681 RepID=UPI0021E09752|nr:type II toxin-antitoxin system death-on-curing family toxin [Acidicapsa acidisoli]
MEPIWVQQRVVIAAHEESLAEHGGPSGIRDLGMLESALARPKNLFAYSETEPSLERMAAAYAFGIATNHPFVDGNKRTALIASITFLRLNGIRIEADKAETYLTFYGLAAGTITEEQLTEWFVRNRIKL